MSDIFNYDNKAFSVINKIVDCFYASLLWLVFCIPIITIGTSTTAFYETVHKVIRKGKGYVWRTFWGTFKGNLKKTIKIWLIQLALSFVLVFDMKVMQNFLEQGSKLGVLYYFFYYSLFFMFVWVVYTCAYCARIEDDIKTTIKNSLVITVLNLPWSFVMILLAVAAVIFISFSPFFVFVLPTGIFCLYDMILIRVFNKYVNMEEEDQII